MTPRETRRSSSRSWYVQARKRLRTNHRTRVPHSATATAAPAAAAAPAVIPAPAAARTATTPAAATTWARRICHSLGDGNFATDGAEPGMAKRYSRPRQPSKLGRPALQPAASELGLELIHLACPLAELRVGRPLADTGQDPAEGFGAA